ncbi:putative transposase [Mammaliicoccus lentus]
MSSKIILQLVEALKTKYTIKMILSVFNIPKTTYYRWKNKNCEVNLVLDEIKSICLKHKYTCDYRKVTAELNKSNNQNINHKKVQRFMQENGLNCRVKLKKAKRPGPPFYKTSNLLQKNFNANHPLEILTTDITYLPFGKTMLYLSSIMDLYNGEIIAYTIGTRQDQKLVNNTLNQLELPSGCIVHSDQGSVYTSYEYYKLCEEKGITRSMSRKGTPADNAPIECFHSSLKCETFYLNNELNSFNDIVIDIVKNYIQNYNNVRIQQKLGYLSPIEFRKLAA